MVVLQYLRRTLTLERAKNILFSGIFITLFITLFIKMDGSIYPINEYLMFKAMKNNTVTSIDLDMVLDKNGEPIYCSWISQPYNVDDNVYTRITLIPKEVK